MAEKGTSAKRSAGRPSKEAEDRSKLLYMLELWCAGNAERSFRELSRIAVGQQSASIMKTVPRQRPMDENSRKALESEADRLRRRFSKLDKDGLARPMSVFLVHHRERLVATHKNRTDEWVIERTASRCGVAREDMLKLANEGWKLVDDWFPRTYSPPNGNLDDV
jgi:hypothetical protein